MLFTNRHGSLSTFGMFFDADNGGAGGGGGAGGDGDGNTGEEKKSFTQAELDKIFSDRLKNVKSNTTTEILQALGVDSLDAVRELVKKQKEADEANKTELQKAQEEAAKAKDEAQKLKQAQEAVMAQAQERLMQAEAMKLAIAYKDASGIGFRPEAINDVWLVLDRSQVKTGDNGTFEGLKEAIEAVAKARPHWLVDSKQLQNPRGTPGGKNQSPNNQQNQQQTNRRPFTL